MTSRYLKISIFKSICIARSSGAFCAIPLFKRDLPDLNAIFASLQTCENTFRYSLLSINFSKLESGNSRLTTDVSRFYSQLTIHNFAPFPTSAPLSTSPVFRFTHPFAWKPRGGMVYISTHDFERRFNDSMHISKLETSNSRLTTDASRFYSQLTIHNSPIVIVHFGSAQ